MSIVLCLIDGDDSTKHCFLEIDDFWVTLIKNIQKNKKGLNLILINGYIIDLYSKSNTKIQLGVTGDEIIISR